MSRKQTRRLTQEALRRPFTDELKNQYPPILSPSQLAELLGYSVSTVYAWVSAGRFDGCFRRRGKHLRFWRDCVVDLFFNAPAWEPKEKDQ